MPGRSARPSAERLHLVVEQRASEAHGEPAPRGELALGPFVLIVAAGRRISNSTLTSRLSGRTVFAAIVGVRAVIGVMPLCGTAGSAKRRMRTIAQFQNCHERPGRSAQELLQREWNQAVAVRFSGIADGPTSRDARRESCAWTVSTRTSGHPGEKRPASGNVICRYSLNFKS